MRVLLFGIYGIGERSLARLCEAGLAPAAVVTKPDAPEAEQPVARAARALGLPVHQPQSPKEPGFVEAVRALAPELIAVAGYHKIIPASVLDVPPLGTLNLHGSMLPKYRGPCTWKWAIMNGEKATGVTVHYMTPQLDNGDIVAQRAVPILPEDTAGLLFDRIAETGALLLAQTVGSLSRGEAGRTPQDEGQATYFGYPSEADCRVDWSQRASQIRDQVRGLNPSPGAWTWARDRRVRLWASRLDGGGATGEAPGTVLRCDGSAFTVATGEGALAVTAAGPDGAPVSVGPLDLGALGIAPGLRLGVAPEGGA